MELAAQLRGKRVYLDSNVFIYAFENVAGFGVCADILRLADNRSIEAVTSEISLLEILVGPLIAGARDLAALYAHRLDTAPGLELVSITRAVVFQAAAIRAGRKLKLPDAVHVGTAVETGCDFFVTADTGIPTSGRLPVIHLAATGG